MQTHNRTSLFFFITSLAMSAEIFAASPLGDLSTPIQITSDHASLEELKKIAIYEGHVILTQGSHQLQADTLTVKKELKDGTKVITAIGKPATFSGKLTNDPAPLHASANTIHYYPDKQLIVLEGSAILEHEQDKFQGPSLSYQLDKQVITATKQNNERPTITIHPRA
ncbi:MAG: lipopolysaccharide transport periplasmic protein LptA [Candidatus Berkiellales bacterium]